MKHTFVGRVVAALALGVTLSGGWIAPAAAQSECTCVLPAGTTGTIATVNGSVYVPGTSGLVNTAAGQSIGSGSSVYTSEGATAGIDMGASCKFSMQGSMSMRVVPQEGNLCVQVYDDSATGGAVTGGGEVGPVVAVAAGAGVLVSLGFLMSVSQ